MKAKIGKTPISIEGIQTGLYADIKIYLDLGSWRKHGEIPPVLYTAFNCGGERFWKVLITPSSIREYSTFEFEEYVEGHNCDGNVREGHGFFCHIPDFDYYKDIRSYKFRFTKGEYKGKIGRLVKDLDQGKHCILLFDEDIGGCSLDGQYKKGACIIMSNKELDKTSETVEEG